MANQLKLTRDQLATFLKNHEQIRQFEELFGRVDQLSIDDLNAKILSNSLTAAIAQQLSGRLLEIINKASSPRLIYVDKKEKLPVPVAGVITLADNYTYFFVAVVDLEGSRLVAGQNTTILGTSSENARIKSTGLGAVALISSEWTLPMRNIAIEATLALDLDASGHANQALDWFGVNFTDCATVGTIANYSNFIASDCAFLESDGLTLDGSFDTVGFAQTIFNSASGGTIITIPSTATINRRFRIIYSSFVVAAGETGINVSSSASIPVEGYILDTVNFSGGGTYTTGVSYSDNKALFVNCKGVNNSAAIGFMTMQNNATATTVSSAGDDYKISGTTTLEPISQKFTMPVDNRLLYEGEITRDFRVTAIASLESGNNQELGLYIAKDGTVLSNSTSISITGGTGKAENIISQTVVQIDQNSYIEAFTSNETIGTNITASYLSVIVEALN